VWLDVRQQPHWQFEVRDDGFGFDTVDGAPNETHVGLRIMRERAERIGAELELHSVPGRGTSVILALPPAAPAPPAVDSAPALDPAQTGEEARAGTLAEASP
jgi:two-component system nitrate/nitrite sensor histidine kinase NarX